MFFISNSISVDWLDENKTLREQNIRETETLLMMTKRWNLDTPHDKMYIFRNFYIKSITLFMITVLNSVSA